MPTLKITLVIETTWTPRKVRDLFRAARVVISSHEWMTWFRIDRVVSVEVTTVAEPSPPRPSP